MKIVRFPGSRSRAVPAIRRSVATTLSLRGFEVAAIENLGDADPVIDFEITANRPDCLSMLGIARDRGGRLGLRCSCRNPRRWPAGRPAAGRRRIDDPDLCPRYCAQVFEVDVGALARWLPERLMAAGVRPISNIVDVTNYVMLEIGQPMHAFDLERLGGRADRIRARARRDARTLDGVDRTLDAGHAGDRRRARAQASAA